MNTLKIVFERLLGKRRNQSSLTPLIRRTIQLWLKRIAKFGFLLMMGVGMNAEAGLFGFGGDSWKEEVLLHDGSKIIVKRSQSYGGRHEIGQSPPVKEQEITFAVPKTNKTLTFKSEYGEDIGRANFKLLALHILNDMPYIVAVPNLCLSYNKWGRPNPPYVIFKHDGKEWKRITLQELPTEFKEINLVIETKGEAKNLEAQAIVTAELVKKMNGELEQPEYRTILGDPLAKGWCPQPTAPDGTSIPWNSFKAPLPMKPLNEQQK